MRSSEDREQSNPTPHNKLRGEGAGVSPCAVHLVLDRPEDRPRDHLTTSCADRGGAVTGAAAVSSPGWQIEYTNTPDPPVKSGSQDGGLCGFGGKSIGVVGLEGVGEEWES